MAAGEVLAAAGSGKGEKRCGWRPWAELNVRRDLRHLDAATELPPRAPARDPPYFKSHVVRRKRGSTARAGGLRADGPGPLRRAWAEVRPEPPSGPRGLNRMADTSPRQRKPRPSS